MQLLLRRANNACTRIIMPLSIAIIVLSFCSCSDTSEFRTDQGAIWSTEYHIKYRAPRQMTDSIITTLRRVEMSVSVFNDSSLVSRLNRSVSVKADSILAKVFNGSVKTHRLSHGAFDPTVAFDRAMGLRTQPPYPINAR